MSVFFFSLFCFTHTHSLQKEVLDMAFVARFSCKLPLSGANVMISQACKRVRPVRLFSSHPESEPPRRGLFGALIAASAVSALLASKWTASSKDENGQGVHQATILPATTINCRPDPSAPSTQRQHSENVAPIYRVVLTGGPCGGKTTAITTISEQMKDRGFNVYVVPEAATMLMTGGISPFTGSHMCLFEESIMRTQMNLEDVFHEVAVMSGKPSIILCDRGMMDSSAYVSPVDWQVLLDRNGWTNVRIRDGRYDAIIHMVTAAIGAEEFYTTANNATRLETPQEAAERDLKTREAWMGHPHLRIIDNSTDFAAKINRVVNILNKMVGLPVTNSVVKKKYLLASEPDWTAFPVPLMTFQVEQTFLTSTDGTERSISRRGQSGSNSYSLRTIRRDQAHDKVTETELKKKIASREYVILLSQKDPNRGSVKATRRCFLWKNSYYIVDSISRAKLNENGDIVSSQNDADSIHLMRVDVDSHEVDSISHPEFLKVQRDVSTDSRYKFASVAFAFRQ